MTRLTRAGLLALALPSLYAGLLMLSPTPGATAALLVLSPGPIDHPLHLIGADFDRDGYDDIAIANFQAGTVTILMNQRNGTFAIQKRSPNVVGAATVGLPSAGPLFLATGDLDPEDVDGDRVRNDVDDCPTRYNPPNCRADDRISAPECFVDIPCKDPLKAPLTCTTLDPVTQQCDSDGDGVGDQCQVLDASCQAIDSDGDGVSDFDAGVIDNCPLTPNPSQQLETAAGLDGVCGTTDDNFFLFGTDNLCGTSDDKTSRVGAACSRSADLIILDTSSGAGSTLGLVRVRVNDGEGGLNSRTSLQASSGTSQAALADLNGDRRLDLVVSNSGTDALLFYPGANDGELGGVCAGGSNPGQSCLSTSQCSGGTCEQTQVLLTSGVCSGGISPGQPCATKDNCLGGGICRSTTASGSVATCAGGTAPGKSCTIDANCPGGGICRSPAGPEGVAAADFNGDGRPDLAFANRTAGNLGVLLNSGGAAFAPAPGSPFTTESQPAGVLAQVLLICAGGGSAGTACVNDLDCPGGACLPRSLDADACADPVILSQGPLICMGGGIPGTACTTDDDCGAGGVCRASHGRIQVFTANCSTGSMNPGQLIDLGAGHAPRGGALADFDRDGNLDLAVADFTGGEVLVFRGSGTGTFALAATLTGFASPAAVAALNFDPDTGPNVDLAVLGFVNNRVDLYRNISSPGSLSFAFAPTSPISPWKAISAMSLFPADASAGQDLTLLNATPPHLDVLSGTGTTFRGLPPEPLTGAVSATGMTVADLRQDGLADLLALDAVGGTAIPLISELTGSQTERISVPSGIGPVQAAIAPLTLHAGDYDQDGVADALDNCPTRYNPPGCPANDKTAFPQCFVDNPCKTLADQLIGCANTNAAGQCDNDSDGIGDQCEILNGACQSIDTDLDLVPDYDPFSKRIDNCPWIANSSQSDADTNGIGDACDSSVCTLLLSTGICSAGPNFNQVCSTDVDCEAPVNDAAVVDGAGGALSFLIGDASGGLRQAPGTWSAIGGLANPVAAVIGRFSYNAPSYTCPIFPPIPTGIMICDSDPQPDIMVAERGAPGSGDDALKLYFGGSTPGSFAPPPSPISAQIPLQGDPTGLLIAPDQSVCPNPWLSGADRRYHFDNDGKTSVLAVVEPGTSDLAIYLPSNEGPAPPPGHPGFLPLQSPPVDAAFVDLNQDGYLDLVSLSSGDGNPSTPNLMVHIGVGNGLFFTDPSLNPTDVPDGMTLMAAGNVNLATDFTYPDLVLFDGVNQAPVIMTNVLTDRSDIDRSGRVDGFDLALLARAFGAERGEDFTIQSDGTILQSPDLTSSPAYLPTRLVVGSGVLQDGMDLPATSGATTSSFVCNRALDRLTPFYGIPVDINLDGKIDGLDLALLASRFGRNVP